MSLPRTSTTPITREASTPDASLVETQYSISTIPSDSPRFHVLWEIDIDADDCRTAAQHAWQSIRRRHSIANIFHVTDRATGTRTSIDLFLVP